MQADSINGYLSQYKQEKIVDMQYRLKKIAKNVLLHNRIGIAIYRLIGSWVRKKKKKLSDEEYFKQSFKENNNIELDLQHPTTFNEKLIWLSIHDRIHLKTICADKYLVREYIKECGYPEILNNLYGVYESVADIDFNTMPETFFIKPTHDSGTYSLINQNDKDVKKKLRKIERSLKTNYYDISREWQYKDIVPQIICEEYIQANDDFGLIDYRFFCTYGEILFIGVDIGTTNSSGKHQLFAKRNIYDEDFNKIEAKLKRDNFEFPQLKKPPKYDKMVEIAKKLSKPFCHVRVDLYNVEGKIIFGELTFLNGGGVQLLEPNSFNKEMGKRIDISRIYEQ